MSSMVWTPIETAKAVRLLLGTPETRRLEFKADVDWRNQDPNRGPQKEMARDVAQFANSDGGTILVGIDRQGSLTHLVEVEQKQGWIEQAVANYLVPPTLRTQFVQIQVDPGSMVLAVNVWPEERLVSVWDRRTHTVEVLRRTNQGKEWLNPDEMEAHMVNAARAKKLAFERVHADNNVQVELSGGLVRWSYPGEAMRVPCLISVSQVTVTHFELTATISGSRPSVNVPWGLVDEVWLTVDRKVGLLLRAQLTLRPKDNTLSLEPHGAPPLLD